MKTTNITATKTILNWNIQLKLLKNILSLNKRNQILKLPVLPKIRLLCKITVNITTTKQIN